MQGGSGRGVMYCEYVAMNLICQTVPGLGPAPVAWGSYFSMPNTWFYVCEFRDTDETSPPSPQHLAASLSELHRKGVSNTGLYGFPVPTHQIWKPTPMDWEVSWEKFFLRLMKWTMDREDECQGLIRMSAGLKHSS